MNLADSDFQLFQIEEQFALDLSELDTKRKALLRETHPDKFTAQGAAAQRVAMQWTVRINEAYARLKDPIKRAAYLCELRGSKIEAENNTAMPADFLMQQMQWREELDEAATDTDFAALQSNIDTTKTNMLAALQAALDKASDLSGATSLVRSLMFITKFEADVRARQHNIQ